MRGGQTVLEKIPPCEQIYGEYSPGRPFPVWVLFSSNLGLNCSPEARLMNKMMNKGYR